MLILVWNHNHTLLLLLLYYQTSTNIQKNTVYVICCNRSLASAIKVFVIAFVPLAHFLFQLRRNIHSITFIHSFMKHSSFQNNVMHHVFTIARQYRIQKTKERVWADTWRKNGNNKDGSQFLEYYKGIRYCFHSINTFFIPIAEKYLFHSFLPLIPFNSVHSVQFYPSIPSFHLIPSIPFNSIHPFHPFIYEAYFIPSFQI